MLSPLYQWTSATWEKGRGKLHDDFEQLTIAVNRLWARAFGFDGFLKNEVVDGTGPIRTGADGNVTTGDIDLSSEVTGRLPFANLVQIAASKLLGRRSSSSGDVEQITIGTGLNLSGTTLSATVAVDYVVASNGANPPNPIDDGAGNFIYIAYTP